MDTFLSSFCQRCGAILPIADENDLLKCKVCKFTTKYKKIEEYSCIQFEHPWLKSKEKTTEKDKDASSGPLIERKCSKCGHDQMSYTTQQLRSADEGQTVFYRCTKCNNQEVENS